MREPAAGRLARLHRHLAVAPTAASSSEATTAVAEPVIDPDEEREHLKSLGEQSGAAVKNSCAVNHMRSDCDFCVSRFCVPCCFARCIYTPNLLRRQDPAAPLSPRLRPARGPAEDAGHYARA